MRYDGMTTNERLFSANLLDDFQKAMKENKVDEALGFLLKVDFNQDEAEKIINIILEDPSRYGF